MRVELQALHNNKYSNSAPLSFPGSYPRIWEKKDKKIIWVIRSYDYQWIMVSSINFVLALTSNKRWDSYKYEPFHLGTTQLFSFLSQILSIECRPKREKKYVTIAGRVLCSVFSQHNGFFLLSLPITAWKYFEHIFFVFFFFLNHCFSLLIRK